MEQLERDVYVGKNRLQLLDENILAITIVGEVDIETAVKCKTVAYKFMDIVARDKMKTLIDLTQSAQQPSESRKLVKEIWNDDRTGKVAIFGLNPVAKAVASFVIGATQKEDIHFFKTKEDALVWLKE